MPLFALTNAGVALSDGKLVHPISLGIIGGLVIGKQVGIVLFSWIAVQSRIAVLPQGVRWSQLYGVGWLGGIGFTMSLFIANLAFQSAHLIEISKLGILVASLISAAGGIVILYSKPSSLNLNHPPKEILLPKT